MAGSGAGHPSLDIVSSRGAELAGKRVVLCVAGSVAAYKAIELGRLLMRHGADVTCVASAAATRLVRPDYLRWATGNRVVTRLTGDLEHIRLADRGGSDLVIVYPATANTLGKLANGIDDTPVSTVLTVALGAKIPILMCMAMHEAMYENAAVRRNMGFLAGRVRFLDPEISEGKAKAAEPEGVLGAVLDSFGASPVWKGRRVLVAAGPTVERIDPVRAITSASTGRTGVLLASKLVSAGARVTLIYGPGREAPPPGARTINVVTGREMLEAAKKEAGGRFDVVIMAAAVSDYAPRSPRKAKIKSSARSLVIKLERTPKIIDLLRRAEPGAFLVGFKAEADVPRESLVRSARKKMAESGADLMIANDVGSRYRGARDRNEVIAVDGDGAASSGWRSKEAVAEFIKREIGKRLE